MNSAVNIPGLERIDLSKLSDITKNNILVVGIIIAKQQPRQFEHSYDFSKNHTVWNFTMRDSPLWYINVACWGVKEQIHELNEKFHVGDVVNIMQPSIEVRKPYSRSETFRPPVTSPFTLIIRENAESKVIAHQGNCHMFYKFLHLPTKPIIGAYTIADIHNRKDKVEGIDLLGVVRTIREVRNIKTRENGTLLQVREVIILDRTSPALRVTLWDPDLINRAGNWKICETVLFITNVRCEWSMFYRAMVATLTSATILTEDPRAVEAEHLRKYAKSIQLQPIAILNQAAISITNVQNIQNVMNVQQVLDKIAIMRNVPNIGTEDHQFTALLYAVITTLDLDGLSRLTTSRCEHCQTMILSPATNCTNNDCPVGCGKDHKEPVRNFDVRVTLTDQTSSLINGRLTGQIAETVLGCSLVEFFAFSDEAKTLLKWKHLMERKAVRILVMCNRSTNPMISILSWEPASPSEVAHRLPHS